MRKGTSPHLHLEPALCPAMLSPKTEMAVSSLRVSGSKETNESIGYSFCDRKSAVLSFMELP